MNFSARSIVRVFLPILTAFLAGALSSGTLAGALAAARSAAGEFLQHPFTSRQARRDPEKLDS